MNKINIKITRNINTWNNFDMFGMLNSVLLSYKL
jgi:hypothetical protein